ncbi:hypothetical protein [Corynebacterium sp. NML130628]|nr:hypothetical protein [Corynebacterium sp. NML130628]
MRQLLKKIAAAPGANRFSGNAKVHPSAVRPGERVCSYGATTRRE